MNHHVPCSGVPPDDLLDLIYHYKALLIRQLHLWFAGREAASINAKAVYDFPAGRIESGWRYEGDTVAYEFTIPTSITAHIHLPDGRTRMLSAGTHRL